MFSPLRIVTAATAIVSVMAGELVARHETPLASVEIWRDETGTWLDLNGDIMSHTLDEDRYHQTLVHPALLSASAHHRVLVIGGSEGATLREILRHPSVKNVTMVDIDEGLVDMCRTHLPMMHKGSFSSPKLHLLFEDGALFLQRQPSQVYDIVIVDGIDFDAARPYGNSLFASRFYSDALRVLRPGGVFVQYMSDVERRPEMHQMGFNQTLSFGVDIPSYRGFGARFVMATKQYTQHFGENLPRLIADAKLDGKLSFLTPETMMWSLSHTARRLKGASGGSNAGGGGGAPPVWVIIVIVVVMCWCPVMVCCVYLKDEGYLCSRKKTRGVNLESDSEETSESGSEASPG